VLAALDERLPRNAILVEETPSSRPELHARVAAREPFGFVSAAMGGLGFALPGSIGIRMATPDRPVVAVVGDGSSLYSIQALWSAAHYGVGVLFVILSNGGYAVWTASPSAAAARRRGRASARSTSQGSRPRSAARRSGSNGTTTSSRRSTRPFPPRGAQRAAAPRHRGRRRRELRAVIG
jgi:thiamine pyrophosphate-dependent acetolactate synthase large subunit-like protein